MFQEQKKKPLFDGEEKKKPGQLGEEKKKPLGGAGCSGEDKKKV